MAVEPSRIDAPDTFTALSVGASHACAVGRAGAAHCWGDNQFGQLGVGAAGAVREVPAPVDSPHPFASISAGANHSCAVTVTGEAYCWGQNTFGQLGDGSTVDAHAPVAVESSVQFVELDAIGSHTCGRTGGGAILCWGNNLEGQLGDGTRSHRTRPVEVGPSDT